MRPNPIAPWELRVGNLRVYYHVLEVGPKFEGNEFDLPEAIVVVVAVGVKYRNRVRIGGEDVDL